MRPPVNHVRFKLVLRALGLSTLACGLFLVIRCRMSGVWRFDGYFGNELLAWIPALLAYGLWRRDLLGHARGWLFWGTGLLWLLFFPNAPYIVTDLIHLKKYGMDGIPKWFDAILVMAFAWTGLGLGFLSLYLVQQVVRRHIGWRMGWIVVVIAQALAAVGVLLGREMRLNSWDVLTRPFHLAAKSASVLDMERIEHSTLFVFTFFVFHLTAYTGVASMIRLHEPEDQVEKVTPTS
jgi:uncharacterized membrane protein